MKLCRYPVRLTAWDNTHTHKYSATVLVLYFGSKEMFSGLQTAKRNGRQKKKLQEFSAMSTGNETLCITDTD